VSSALDDVTNAVLTMLRAIPELSGVAIDDSGEPSSRTYAEAIIVGDDGDPDTDVESSFTQEWANLSHTKRSEFGDVQCAAAVQSGSTRIETRRTRASQILGYFETALRTDPTLGGVVFTSEIVSGASRPIQNSEGSAIIIPFTVRYWTHV
jgi:hypothetical protein